MIAVFPMEKKSEIIDYDIDEEDEEDTETAKFDAQTHVQFLKLKSQLYGFSFNDWVLCLLCDNLSVDKRISNLTGKPLAGCNNQKRDLEVSHFISTTSDLQSTISDFEVVVHEAKGKQRNADLLRNLTNLKPILGSRTHWSGFSDLQRRFVLLRDDLINVNKDGKGIYLWKAAESLNPNSLSTQKS